MSVEQEDPKTPEPAKAPEPPKAEPKAEPKKDEKPAGYDPVDVAKATPEEMQTRINYLWGQVKGNETMAKTAIEDASKMAERVHALESKVGQKDVDDATTAIKRQLADAAERGDGSAVGDLVDQLIHVKQPVKVAEPVRPKPVHEPETAAVRAWADERSDTGDPKRPWTQEGHPYQSVAANVGAAVMEHPNWAHRPLGDRLTEIERRMNAEMGAPSTPAVLDSGNAPPRKEKTELSSEQKRVAYSMKPSLSQAEAETWYLKALKGTG